MKRHYRYVNLDRDSTFFFLSITILIFFLVLDLFLAFQKNKWYILREIISML